MAKADVFTPLQVRALAETFETVMNEVDARIAAALAALPPTVRHAGTWADGKQFKGGIEAEERLSSVRGFGWGFLLFPWVLEAAP